MSRLITFSLSQALPWPMARFPEEKQDKLVPQTDVQGGFPAQKPPVGLPASVRMRFPKKKKRSGGVFSNDSGGRSRG